MNKSNNLKDTISLGGEITSADEYNNAFLGTKENEKLVLMLVKETLWQNMNNGISYDGLDNALQSIFDMTSERNFRIKNNCVYLVEENV